MNNLPIEILNGIFISLHQQDKVECMATCQLWKRIIQSTNLFRTIHVSSEQQLESIIKKPQEDLVMMGEKVEDLFIGWSLEIWKNKHVIHDCFPNIKTLLSFTHRCTSLYPVETKLQTQPWKNIEYMNCLFEDFKTIKMLQAGVYSCLKKLVLYSREYYRLKPLAEKLSNAPALRILRLYEFAFVISDLELLHENTPYLTSFTLEGHSEEDTTMDYPLHEVRPISSLKKVCYRNHSPALIRDIKTLQYIKIKYTNISELIYTGQKSRQANIKMQNIIINELSIILDRLGPQLKKLSLDIPCSNVAIGHTLDHSGSQLKELSLHSGSVFPVIEKIAQSILRMSLQTLSAVEFSEKENINLDCLTKFTSLRELHLEQREPKKISIDNLLHLIGDKLEILSLGGFHVVINNPESYEHSRQTYKLKSLSFKKIPLSLQTEKFINMSLPNLKNLTLDLCNLSTRSLSITSDLWFLKIKEKFPTKDHRLVIKTTNNGKRRYWAKQIHYDYFAEIQDEKDFNTILPKTNSSDNTQGVPFATFECRSVKSVVIINDGAILN